MGNPHPCSCCLVWTGSSGVGDGVVAEPRLLSWAASAIRGGLFALREATGFLSIVAPAILAWLVGDCRIPNGQSGWVSWGRVLSAAFLIHHFHRGNVVVPVRLENAMGDVICAFAVGAGYSASRDHL